MVGRKTSSGRLSCADRSEAKTLDLGDKGLAATKKDTSDICLRYLFFYADGGT